MSTQLILTSSKMPKTDPIALLQAMIGLLSAEAGGEAVLPDQYDQALAVWRGLVNRRPAQPAPEGYLTLEREFLTWHKGQQRQTLADCQQVADQIYLYQGDLTQLAVSAIVNPANSELLGCFEPNHICLDNAIHTFAGLELRLACAQLMAAQGRKEAVGQAKLTAAYQLPADWVIHTVGPFIPAGQSVSPIRAKLLKQCYLSCLKLAEEQELTALAFPAIATGQFGFPRQQAAPIAIQTVQNWLSQTGSQMTVIFALFTGEDYAIYKDLLEGN